MKKLMSLIALIVVGTFGYSEIVEDSGIFEGFDEIPHQSDIEQEFGENSSSVLIDVITQSEDPGLRLRAVNALSGFEDDRVEETLITLINQTSSASSGTDVLYTRAALVSLAERSPQRALPIVITLLEHPSVDVRASAAIAAQEMDAAIVPALRTRLSHETNSLVSWHLQVAIAELSEQTAL